MSDLQFADPPEDNWTVAANNAADAFRELVEAMAGLGIVVSEFTPGMSLEEVQAEYHEKIYGYMQDYLESAKPITVYKNEYKRAINDGFTFAFVAGWADAGASELTQEAQDWINGRIQEELGYLDGLFVELKALRADKELTLDEKLAAASAHADGYAGTLTGVYATGKMMGEPERDGRWELGATEEHCESGDGFVGCAWLAGQVHPISWYLDKGYIPQESGSNTLHCHGYHCDCSIKDPKTGKQLVP